MDLSLITTLAPAILVLAFGITFFAGVVKGAIGFAMPLIMVSGLSTVLDPKIAIAAIIIPIVFSNVLQTFRAGIEPARAALREYWRYLLMVCVAIFAAAQLVPAIPTNVFYLVLGIPVVALSLMQLLGLRLKIAPANRARAEWLIGGVSGVLGGLAGTWGPTTVLYLMAVDTPKARQIVVQGVVYGLGSVSLFFAHLNSGILNASTAPLSLLLLVPAVLGMWFGFQIHDRLDQQRFRQITLIVLIVAGLNLIARGIGG